MSIDPAFEILRRRNTETLDIDVVEIKTSVFNKQAHRLHSRFQFNRRNRHGPPFLPLSRLRDLDSFDSSASKIDSQSPSFSGCRDPKAKLEKPRSLQLDRV